MSLVERYVESAEPVSSHVILEDSELNVSSATVRNELAELEDLGFVAQPHTSAGRVPTDAGYRYYVNSLMRPRTLSRSDTNRIRRELQPLAVQVEEILDEACHLLSELTRYTSVILVPTIERDSMRHVQLGNLSPRRLLVILITSGGQVEHKLHDLESVIPTDRLNRISGYLNAALKGKPLSVVKKMKFDEVNNPTEFFDAFLPMAFDLIQQAIPDDLSDRVIVEGIVYILQQPEFSDVQKARQVVEVLDEETLVTRMLNDVEDVENPSVIIGGEHTLEQMRACSFIGMPYHIGGEPAGSVGVVGPTRMLYAEAISAVNYLTRRLEECVSTIASL